MAWPDTGLCTRCAATTFNGAPYCSRCVSETWPRHAVRCHRCHQMKHNVTDDRSGLWHEYVCRSCLLREMVAMLDTQIIAAPAYGFASAVSQLLAALEDLT